MMQSMTVVGPFVDFIEPKRNKERAYKHDLVVNQSVYDEGIPIVRIGLKHRQYTVNLWKPVVSECEVV